jgi:hypothetical protein
MKFKITFLLSFLISQISFGQVSTQINLNIELAEKDSITSSKIQSSLNGFLTEAFEGKYTENYVDSIHRKKYEFFFIKLSEIGKNSKANFNKPLILKSYPVENGNYRITIAFTGTTNGIPFVYQISELKAVPYKEHYRFYCTFEENTKHLKTRKIKNVNYHFSGEIDNQKAKEFVSLVNILSELTKVKKPKIDYFAFQSLDELLKSYGFLFSARQCNFLCYDLGFTDNEGQFFMTGTDNPNYIFGYIEDFLYYNLPNKENIYSPFVLGISTYYGGYSLNYDNINELKQQFRNELKNRPNINFLEEFKKGRKSTVNNYFSFYVMSAFLYQEALKKRGFDEAIKLAYSGENGEFFFKNLKKILDIDEVNFHKTIINIINK